jgi:hypothetical protein
MAVLVIASAAGSPGATTTAVGLALVWPRPVLLLEADTAGSSPILSGYCRGTVAHDRGLINLAIAHRTGAPLGQALQDAAVVLPGSDVRVVPGLAKAAQAAAMTEVWGPLAGVLRRLHTTGTDVLVDAGRLHGDDALPLLLSADLVLLATGTRLPDVAATRSRAAVLRAAMAEAAAPPDALQLLLVGEHRPYSRREVAAAIGLPVAAAVPWDPAGAAVFSDGAPQPRKRTPLARSLTAGAAALATWLYEQPANTAPGSVPGMNGAAPAAPVPSPVQADAAPGADTTTGPAATAPATSAPALASTGVAR